MSVFGSVVESDFEPSAFEGREVDVARVGKRFHEALSVQFAIGRVCHAPLFLTHAEAALAFCQSS